MQRKRTSRRGEGNLGCIFWVIIFGAVALVGWKAIPVKMASSQLEDFMIEQAKFALKTPNRQIKRQIVDRAQELGLPVTDKHVKISKTGSRIRMQCAYTVRLDLPLYEYDWDFKFDVDRAIYQW